MKAAPTSRELEICQLVIAIGKTKAAQRRADETSAALHEKRSAQEAELRLQKLHARLDRANALLWTAQGGAK